MLLEIKAMSMLVSFLMSQWCRLITINRFYVLFTEKELCRVQARKSFNNGRYGNALEWALRSQDNIYVTSIADLFLRVRIKSIINKVTPRQMTAFSPSLSLFCCSITQKPVKFYAKMSSNISEQRYSFRHVWCSW